VAVSIIVEEREKINIAKWGANKLFGDPDKRRKEMTDQELITLFDSVWEDRLRRAIVTASKCQSTEAIERLTPSQRNYFDHKNEHRQFRLNDLNVEFVVQLEKTDNSEKLNQLWRVSSSDEHPKTLFVTFETVEEKEKFKKLAANLGRQEEELGLELVTDFVKKFPESFYQK